jgi:hypothetical protein
MRFVRLIGGLVMMNDLRRVAVIGCPQLVSKRLSGQAKGVGVINLGTCTGLLGVMAIARRPCQRPVLAVHRRPTGGLYAG